jgi:hypothetical protein
MSDSDTTYPPGWGQHSIDTYEAVLAEVPGLAGAGHSALVTACDMLGDAERLADLAAEAGMLSTGAAGQIVTHPAAIEARLARTAAAGILARLAPAKATTKQAAASQRWSLTT